MNDQKCETCRYFIDYRETEGDDWANGYCCHEFCEPGSEPENSDYGGHWTNPASWCSAYVQGQPVFQKVDEP